MEEAVTVNVRAIEDELARIQRELTNTEVRTSLFNLVVFHNDSSADSALTYMLGKRAARVIQISDANRAESSIHASARCFVDAERKGVCFQEVIIENGADGAGAAPGSWSGLLIREIPTFVLWLSSFDETVEVLRHALEQADKVIVDSELSSNVDRVLREMHHLAEGGVAIGDFTWGRLAPLQQLTARSFDGREEMLWEIRRVELSGCSRVYGALFVRWLAERLGWRRGTGADNDCFFDQRGRRIEIDHEPGPTSACDIGAAFATANGNVQIATHADGCVDVDLPDHELPPQIVSFPSNGEILLREVDTVRGSSLLKAAIAM